MKKIKTELLDLQHAAALLGVTPSTIRRWAQAGKLKARDARELLNEL